MKRVLYLLSIVVLLGQSSCNNFLEDSSGDLLIPKNVKEFQALLWGDGYPHKLAENITWMILLSDDVSMKPFNNSTKDRVDARTMGDGLYPYRWDLNIEEKIKDKAWPYIYERILACNNVITALPTMECEKGEEDKIAWLGGAAHTLRAYYYFCLVNWYSEPYSEENINKPGVVIRTEPNITLGDVKRSSIGDTYKLINSDLSTAMNYFSKGRKVTNKKLVTEDAAKFLANRVALFEGRWADVIKGGKEILEKYNDLYNLNNSPAKATFKYYNLSTCFSVLSTDFNPEIIYSFSNPASSNPYLYFTIYPNNYDIGFLTSEENLISTYKTNDLRKTAYYRADSIRFGRVKFSGNYLPVKYSGINRNNCYFMNWRSAEVLLNVAEAYARTDNGVSASAVALLQKLEISRYDGTYTPLTVANFTSKEELLKYVLAERRRELAFEETMRWWDIRRLGCEQITHKYYHTRTEFDTYILPKGSPNFTLQIPASEVDENETIQRNERVVINKQ
ncbi:MAG: RagB/SusD family nutrient uptake outer membrane protein [Rikenellaceae bacterium]